MLHDAAAIRFRYVVAVTLLMFYADGHIFAAKT